MHPVDRRAQAQNDAMNNPTNSSRSGNPQTQGHSGSRETSQQLPHHNPHQTYNRTNRDGFQKLPHSNQSRISGFFGRNQPNNFTADSSSSQTTIIISPPRNTRNIITRTNSIFSGVIIGAIVGGFCSLVLFPNPFVFVVSTLMGGFAGGLIQSKREQKNAFYPINL